MSTKLSTADRAVVRQIVDRCNVGESNLQVIRYLITRLKSGYSSWRAMSRGQRRQLMRWTIARHAQNGAEYTRVMRGGL